MFVLTLFAFWPVILPAFHFNPVTSVGWWIWFTIALAPGALSGHDEQAPVYVPTMGYNGAPAPIHGTQPRKFKPGV